MKQRDANRYALSFTTGGLLSLEALAIAPLYIEVRDWSEVRRLAVQENLLQARTYNTGVRKVGETVSRLAALSDREILALVDVTASERNQLMWVAACRRFKLIGEFAEEVVREHFLTLAGTVTYDDYDSFYRAKALWHEELNDVTEKSYKKLRQVLFRMMVEAGLVTREGAIEPVMLGGLVTELLDQRIPSDVRFFPTRTI